MCSRLCNWLGKCRMQLQVTRHEVEHGNIFPWAPLFHWHFWPHLDKPCWSTFPHQVMPSHARDAPSPEWGQSVPGPPPVVTSCWWSARDSSHVFVFSSQYCYALKFSFSPASPSSSRFAFSCNSGVKLRLVNTQHFPILLLHNKIFQVTK